MMACMNVTDTHGVLGTPAEPPTGNKNLQVVQKSVLFSIPSRPAVLQQYKPKTFRRRADTRCNTLGRYFKLAVIWEANLALCWPPAKGSTTFLSRLYSSFTQLECPTQRAIY